MVSIESVVIVSLAVIVVVLLLVMGLSLRRAFGIIDMQNQRQHEANSDMLESIMSSSDTWRENERVKLDYEFAKHKEAERTRVESAARRAQTRPDGEQFDPVGTQHVVVGDDVVGGP